MLRLRVFDWFQKCHLSEKSKFSNHKAKSQVNVKRSLKSITLLGMFSKCMTEFQEPGPGRGFADSPDKPVLVGLLMNSMFVFVHADMEIFNMMLYIKILS